MMKSIHKNFIATLILGLLFSFFLPWWNVMVAAFVAGIMFPLKRWLAFFTPFLAIFILWSFQTSIISSSNDFILAKKIAQLLYVNNTILLIILTGIIGGLAAGLAGVYGKQFLNILKNQPQ